MNIKNEPMEPVIGDLVKIIHNSLSGIRTASPTGVGIVITVVPKSDKTRGYAAVRFQETDLVVNYFFGNLEIIRKKEDSV